MKKIQIIAAAAAITLSSTAMLPVSADEEKVMTFRMDADKTYVCLDDQKEDTILKGALYIDNYTGLTSMRLMLKSDEPVIIENGGFTVDPVKKDADGEPMHLLFAEHADSNYTQKAEVTDDTNVVLWYAKNYTRDAVAAVNDATSSFVHFDVRVPKGTKPGDYKCYISENITKNIAGLNEYDSFVYQGGDTLVFHENLMLEPLTVSVYLRGDMNMNGEVSIDDAQLTLKAYTAQVAGNPTDLTPAQIKASDVNEDGEVSVDDAQSILKYYTGKYVAGKDDFTWDDVIKK